MKKRDFIKSLIALPLASKAIADSMMKTKEVVVKNVPPRTPEKATQYITNMFSGEIRQSDFESQFMPIGFGLAEKQPTAQNVEFHHHIIYGSGKSKSEAWENFWWDFWKQTKDSDETQKILWRRMVEADSNRDFDTISTEYVVRCRFSLV